MAQRRGGFGRNADETDDDAPKAKLNRETLGNALTIFRFLMPYRWQFGIGLVLLAISSMVFMVFPWAFGEWLNIARGKGKYLAYGLDLNGMAIFLGSVLLTQGFVSYMRVQLFAIVSERGIADIRKALYEKLLTLPVPYLEERRVGELSSRLTSDVNQIQDAFSITLAEFLRQIIVLVAGIGLIMYTSINLSLIMLATFPFIVVGAIVFGRYIRKLSKERQDEVAQSNVIVEETLQSVNVVKAFTNEWYEYVRYTRSLEKVVRLSLAFAHWRGLFFAFVVAALFGGIVFMMWQGVQMVASGTIQEGDLVAFIMYTMIIGGAIGGVGDLYTQLLRALGSTERLREILLADGEIPSLEPIAHNEARMDGDIEFRDVRFTYPSRPELPILKGLSIHARAGQKIALVGQSGAGKSTIIQLLLRFYETGDGIILADGKNIADYDLRQYRSNIALVPQEVMLFGGSIRENIEYGKAGATDDEIREAARKANALSFIERFPEGLNTIVGERGVKLSGGQRQRIAIARAILRDPAVLLLDEATSSLDAESEKVVQEALEELMKGRTSIIVAHRLATIRDVDCIYVLENGEVVESGTHDELAAIPDGVYSNLARLQFDAVM